MELKNKVAVVVGATGGMGMEVCNVLGKEGVKLVLVARNENKLRLLSVKWPDSDYFICDLNKPQTIKNICEQILMKYPGIDFLLNIAGIGVYKPIEEVTEVEWQDSFNSNVTANYYFIKYLLPGLKKSTNAYAINWGSGMGVIPAPQRSVYCAAKFALRGLSLSLAKEFERTNIHIIHLTLGSVLTEFGPLSLDQKQKENLEGKTYLTPQWVAGQVVKILKENESDWEIPLYPSGYKQEMER